MGDEGKGGGKGSQEVDMVVIDLYPHEEGVLFMRRYRLLIRGGILPMAVGCLSVTCSMYALKKRSSLNASSLITNNDMQHLVFLSQCACTLRNHAPLHSLTAP